MVVISASGVKAERSPIRMTTTVNHEVFLDKKVEMNSSISQGKKGMKYIKNENDMNGFLYALHLAFSDHYPLEIQPDHLWILIEMAVSIHVNENSEKLRGTFVKFDGKKTIVVIDDSLVMGSENNKWEPNFALFEEVIGEQIGKDKSETLVCDFSTSTSVEKVASQIVLMDTVKSYFSYVMLTRCGIPSIELQGTKDDYLKIIDKINKLKKIFVDLDWWFDELLPVVKQFVSAFDGQIDNEFWNDIYKWKNSSGGPYVSGWVNVFFPYLVDKRGSKKKISYVKNEFCRYKHKTSGFVTGPTPNSFPASYSCVDFIWDYMGKNYNMNLYAGFFNPTQSSSSLAIRPNIEWVITHSSTAAKQEKAYDDQAIVKMNDKRRDSRNDGDVEYDGGRKRFK